jgi:SAM-dependent methyltransferase
MQNERTSRIKALGYDYDAQAKVSVEHCNLCGNDYFVHIAQTDRYGYAVNSFACAQCGLVFLNPRMTPEGYAQFYSNIYRRLVSAYHGRLIDAKSIQAEQKNYAAEKADFLAPYTEKLAGTLLDIGGSTGIVAKHFVDRFDLQAKVLDPSAKELDEAQNLGLGTIQGFFEQTDFGDQKFDLILLCQTIDHLSDIGATLDKVYSCLSKEGVFFVDIVDFRAAYLRHWDISEAIKIDHPYYLTQESVEAFLERKGFVIFRKGYAADHLHVNYACGLGTPKNDHVPAQSTVEQLLREIRTVQNAPPKNGVAL